MNDNNFHHSKSNVFLTSSKNDKCIHSHNHFITYSLIIPKKEHRSYRSRNNNNSQLQTTEFSLQRNCLTDRTQFYSFPIIPFNSSKHKDNGSFNYNLTHPDKPVDISHKINFNANPTLIKGNVLSKSLRFYESILNTPLEIQQMKAKNYFQRNVCWSIKDVFNKIKLPKDYKRFEILKHLSQRERRFAEIQNRKVFKYKEGKDKNKNKFRKAISHINNKNQINERNIVKAKDIIIKKLPGVRGIGYQVYGTEKKEECFDVKSKVKIINIG